MGNVFIVVGVFAALFALFRAAQGKYLGAILIVVGSFVLQFIYAAGAPVSVGTLQAMAAMLAVVGALFSFLEI
ncbi:hypothetical protein [Herbaspirillum huttiense]|uniref:hypothetical protein n=1 Tax=Herbaspirillum huttiense TaxID=863372 RepID=UPI002176DEBB|nr:hypothetical protein [Herbaspirillum huttiense]UWE19379.1 hypothetical protein NY669_26755 [Herbaspirillum huttiense]